MQNEVYEKLRLLSERVAKISWVRNFLGQKYVEKVLFLWCRENFSLLEQASFTDFLTAKAKTVIKTQTVCVPIALMEIEEDFTFGPVEIISLTAEFIEEREQARMLMSSTQLDQTQLLFADISKKIQGLAAIRFNMRGADNHVKLQCYNLAKDIIGLIRLYSTAAYNPWIVCPCDVLGLETAPSKTLLSYSDRDFSFSEGSATSNLRHWRLSNFEIKNIRNRGLEVMARLVKTDNLSKFQSRVRSSLLTYSKGITSTDLGDRLVYTFSAMEALLIRDASEPIQQNLGERMAFLIEVDPTTRQAIVKNVKDAYAIRSRYIHYRIQISDEKALEIFIRNARATLDAAINNMDAFPTQTDFIDGTDRIKFGHLS